jgi:hypothetical protein
VFGLEVRQDILHRMVRYQQLKAMSRHPSRSSTVRKALR